MCSIKVPLGSTILYRFIVDGIDQFDPSLPVVMKGTQMFNKIVAPNEKIAHDMLNMDINELENYEKSIIQSELKSMEDPTFDDVDEHVGDSISVNIIKKSEQTSKYYN